MRPALQFGIFCSRRGVHGAKFEVTGTGGCDAEEAEHQAGAVLPFGESQPAAHRRQRNCDGSAEGPQDCDHLHPRDEVWYVPESEPLVGSADRVVPRQSQHIPQPL